jgi:hypothetical protein
MTTESESQDAGIVESHVSKIRETRSVPRK